MKNVSIYRSMLSRLKKGSTRVFTFLLVFSMLFVSLHIEPMAAEAQASAQTIRLAKTEGSVKVTDSAAKAMLKTDNMRLGSGSHSVTSEASYAWLSLDDSKALKEDAVSEVELRQSADGRQLEVMLDSGNLFFNVTAPLQEDETLNIRTSTMVMGVRGTCGWVQVINGKITRVWILEGVVTCFVTNPIFGQTKWITLHGGEYADFLVYDPSQPGDKTDIIIQRFGRDDIPGFVLKELVGDDPTIWKIWEDSGIDLRDLTDEEAEERLKRDEAEMAEKMRKVREQEAAQENHISKDPVWERLITDDDDSSSSSSSNNNEETPSRIRTLTMKVTAQEVQDLLDDDGVDQVILQPGSGDDNTLDIDIPFTVPEGKTLTTQSGVPVDVNAGNSMTVNGTADLGDTLTNNGTTNVNSNNTLKVAALITNNATFNNNSTGRTVASAGLNGTAGSTFTNAGQFEGSITGYGAVNITGGTVSGSIATGSGTSVISGGTVSGGLTVSGGTVTVNGGTISGDAAVSGGTLSLSGGAVTGGASLSGGTLNVNGGTVSGSASASAGTMNISSGSVGGDVNASGSGTINMSGGSVGGNAGSTGSGSFKQTGGTIGGDVSVNTDDNGFDYDSGTITGSVVVDKGNFTVNGSFSVDVTVKSGSLIVTSGGYLDGNITGAGGSLIMRGGTVEGNITGNFGTVNISDGTINGNVTAPFTATALTMSGGTLNGYIDSDTIKTFTMSGGTINDFVRLENADTVTVSGGEITTDDSAALIIVDTNLDNVRITGGTLTGELAAVGCDSITGTLSYSGGATLRSRQLGLVVEPAISGWGPLPEGGYYILSEAYDVAVDSVYYEPLASMDTPEILFEDLEMTQIAGGAEAMIRFTGNTALSYTLACEIIAEGSTGDTKTVTVPGYGTGTISFTMPDKAVTVWVTDATPARTIAMTGSVSGVNIRAVKDGADITELKQNNDFELIFENTTNNTRTVNYTIVTDGGVNIGNGYYNIAPGGGEAISLLMPDDNITITLTDPDPLYDITLSAHNGTDLDDFTVTKSVNGYTVDQASEGNSVELLFRNTAADVRERKVTITAADSTALYAGTLNFSASGGAAETQTVTFTMPAQAVTVDVEDPAATAYAINVVEAGETPGVLDYYDVSIWSGGEQVILVTAGSVAYARIENTTDAERNIHFEIKGSDSSFVGAGYEDMTIAAGGFYDVEIPSMPAMNVTVTVYDGDLVTVLHTPLITADINNAMMYGKDQIIAKPGTDPAQDTVTITSVNVPAAKTLQISEDVRLIKPADGNVLTIYGQLMNYGKIENSGEIILQTSGVLRNAGSINNLSGAVFTNDSGCEIDNLGDITNASGATFTNEAGATVDNQGDFTNEAGATFVNNGTWLNNSPHTFINYGTVINSETGVIDNGPDQQGRFLNLSDGTDTGVILNAGDITNEAGSIFVNEGLIVAGPAASSPELEAGSNPVIESALGGMCGENIHWYLTKLITDDEYDADEDITLPEGLALTEDLEEACVASGADSSSDLYALFIIGTGEMDDFEPDGDTSTAPWNEGGYTIVSARVEAGVESIGAYAFFGLENLAKLTYAGDEDGWNALEVGEGNDILDWVEISCEADGSVLNEGMLGYAAMNAPAGEPEAEELTEEALPEETMEEVLSEEIEDGMLSDEGALTDALTDGGSTGGEEAEAGSLTDDDPENSRSNQETSADGELSEGNGRPESGEAAEENAGTTAGAAASDDPDGDTDTMEEVSGGTGTDESGGPETVADASSDAGKDQDSGNDSESKAGADEGDPGGNEPESTDSAIYADAALPSGSVIRQDTGADGDAGNGADSDASGSGASGADDSGADGDFNAET